MRTIMITGAALLAALLAGCGGGGDAVEAMPAPAAARAPLAACDTQGLASGQVQLVGSECVNSTTALTPTRTAQALQATSSSSITAAQLMDWAESTFSSLFPSAGKVDGVLSPYTYRYYPATGNYIGVTASDATPSIYLYGNISGWQIRRVGALADYSCTVSPSSCTSVPGAPTIQGALAANAAALITVAAPTTGGGSITRYNATCTANSSLSGSGSSTNTAITVSGLVNGTTYSCTATATNAAGTGAASAAVTVTPSASATTTGTSTLGGSTGSTGTTGTTGGTSSSGTSTAGVQCSYSYSALNSSLNLTSTANWSCSSTQRMLSGNGVPDHTTGTFPNSNNPTAIKAITVNASMPISPALASSTTTNIHVVGYAFNSVKMDPATAATCGSNGTTVSCTADGNTYTWVVEAIGQRVMNLGLDSSNAHVQPDGSYHYHGMPEGYLTKLGKGTALTLVGYALDGFPIYARYGYTTATDATSAIKVVKASYSLKTTPDSGRPSTSSYPMGTFTQDYQYSAGLGDLDECNGRYGVTPEFPSGIYHYYITDTWPYIGRCLKGTPTTAR